ncbi:MAG: dual specificity protein phosphatase family protein [bacterium]
MGFAAAFFGFAAFFAWLTLLCEKTGGVDAITLGFAYAALAEAFTGSLYMAASLFGVNPGGMFKTPSGEVRRIFRLLTWPYLFFEYGAWYRYRQQKSEPLFEEVEEGLFIGARLIEEDVPSVREAGIKAVLDLIAEFGPPSGIARDPGMTYLALPVLDGTAPSLSDLDQAARFVHNARQAGAPLLVHCTFGHGRSATVIAAYLLKTGSARNIREAMQKLTRLERKIWLSREQKKVLKTFEKSLSN